ncbi:MAG: hypothetical protein J6E43_01370 [Prevotella sp.]|nr:hypothetical protein [Prevotella sp.]
MKKSFIWTLAAALTCGMAFTSCAKQDYPTPWNDPDSGWGNYSTNSSTEANFENEDDLTKFEVADASKLAASVVEDEAAGSKVAQFVRSGSSGFGFAALKMPELEDATKAKVAFDFMIPAEILGQSAISLGDANVHNATNGGFNTTSGQYGFGTNGAIFYMGAFRGKAYGKSNENYFQINGVPAAASQEEHLAADVWGNWFHADFEIDITNKTVNYAISKGNEIWWEGEDVAFVSENVQSFTQLSLYVGYSGTYKIDNVKITKTSGDPNVEYADYTISYVDTEGNAIPEDLKTTITRRGKVGDAITLLDADKADFSNADGSIKYTYQSDNSEGATITAEGTQIKIVYKSEVVPKYQYIFNCMIEGATGADAILAQIRGEEFEGKTTTVYLPIGYYKNGKCYTTAPAQYNGKTAAVNGTEAKTQGYILTTINYSLDENMVYFADCEDMEIVGGFENGFSWGTFNRVSQGKHIRLNAGTSMTTKDAISTAGTYDIALYVRNDSKTTSTSVTPYIVAADGTETKVEVASSPESYGNAGMGWFTFAGVTIPAGAKLKFVNETTLNGIGYDCLKVTKPAAE